MGSDHEDVRKQVAVVILLMLGFAGAGSSALLTRALARSKSVSAVEHERQLGPKPTPRWFWRWVEWRLGEGYAKGHPRRASLRPRQAPTRIDRWAWRRLHFYLIARNERTLAAQRNGKKRHRTTTTSTTTTSTTRTTTTATTTTTTTTSSGGGGTYDQAIAYTQTRPSFTPARTIEVSNASELNAAISNLQPGDLVDATGSFTVSGETVIKSRLSSPAELDLRGVSFVYSGGSNVPAVVLNNAQNLYIYGGDATTADTGGTCIRDYGSQHVLWWGFTAHDCGGGGFSALTVNGNVDHDDFQGEIWKIGQNLAWDPHADKGTGLHCAGENWDVASTNYSFTNNRLAFYCHDIPTGAAFAFGHDAPTTATARGNTLYLKAVNLTCRPTTQTCGNGVELWGATSTMGLDIKYLEVDNAQGMATYGWGVSAGAMLNGVTVEYGRASNVNLNASMDHNTQPWDTSHEIAYEDVRPTS